MYQLTDNDVATLRQMRSWQQTFTAANSVNGPGGAAAAQSAARRSRRRIIADDVFIKITSSAQDGSNLRWTYTARVQTQSGSGWSGWSDLDGTDVTAYNGIEAPNGSSGLLGCGITVANIPSGFALQPISAGAIVPAEAILNSSGAVEYWFSATNQVDGSCSGGGS